MRIEFRIKRWARPTGNKKLPPLLRRRITPLGQAAMAAAVGVGDVGDARIILASRHGEAPRTQALLDAAANGGVFSPADFSLSVHHALAGLLSIEQKNTSGHTALSAGEESLFLGLVEAAACLAENPAQNVFVVHYDAASAIALLLSAAEGEKMTMEWTPAAGKTSATLAEDFATFLSGKETHWEAAGESMQWRFRKNHAPE